MINFHFSVDCPECEITNSVKLGDCKEDWTPPPGIDFDCISCGHPITLIPITEKEYEEIKARE